MPLDTTPMGVSLGSARSSLGLTGFHLSLANNLSAGLSPPDMVLLHTTSASVSQWNLSLTHPLIFSTAAHVRHILSRLPRGTLRYLMRSDMQETLEVKVADNTLILMELTVADLQAVRQAKPTMTRIMSPTMDYGLTARKKIQRAVMIAAPTRMPKR
jgi:hypothetical protein